MKLFRVLFAISALLLFNSCSSSEDEKEQPDDTSLLIGEWQRISTEDQDGEITDDTYTCDITEFTSDSYIVTDYTDADCTQEFSSGSLPYIRVDDLIYFGEVSQDIKVEITELSSSTLKLKQEYSDGGVLYYDIVTYKRK
jgi:hypothetical protein